MSGKPFCKQELCRNKEKQSAVTQRKQNTREFYLRQIILKIGKYRKHRPDFRPEYVIMKSIGTSSKEEMKVKQD